MNKMQLLESLSRIIDKLHNAMDEINDIEDNEFPKHAAMHYLVEAEMDIDNVMEEIETLAHLDGTKSGAI